MSENIRQGQRVEKFTLEAFNRNGWQKLTQGTTIGYKRLLRFDLATAKKVRLTIDASRACPELIEIGLFKSSNQEKL